MTSVRRLLPVLLLASWSCAGEVSGPPSTQDPGPRTATGVAGKPLVDGVGGVAIADELLIALVDGASELDAELAALDAGGEVVWRGPRTGYYVIRFDTAAAAAAGARILATDPKVIDVVPQRIAGGTGVGTSPGPVDLQWNLHALDLDPSSGWGSTAGIPIAVLDTGAAYEDHADALGTYAVAPDLVNTPFGTGWDFINDDSHPNDDQGHGTHIAGVIAASAEEGIYPTALGAQIVPVKVLDASNQGTELGLAEGIFWAIDHGARVINMSLAFPPSFYPSRFLQAAIDTASNAGIVMVAAVGNHGANVVTYPAAFREVIAVGASALKPTFHSHKKNQWKGADRKLDIAPYSNRSARVDVAAPGGVIDEDINGDGNPEAILAQTFVGDPTDLDYYFYAGTSQAAAQVSGLAAHMLATNPALTPFEVRALMGETARLKNWMLLSQDAGRGFVQGDDAIEEAAEEQPGRPRFHVNTYLTIHRQDGLYWAEATVEVIDEAGAPVPWAQVWGAFTGGVFRNVSSFADWRGQVRFKSPEQTSPLLLVGFQVEAVRDGRDFDRPRGFLRIDSCSLEMVSEFATGQGVGTSPGPNLLTLNYSLVASRPATQVDTLTMLNFAWDLATVPTTVAVDRDWFFATYPEAYKTSVASVGTGVGTSPIQVLSAQSFDPSVQLPWTEPPSPCSDLLVRTFASGAADGIFQPLVTDPIGDCDDDGDCAAIDDALSSLWTFWGAGVGTSPSPVDSLTASQWTQLEEMTISYAELIDEGAASPVEDYGAVLTAAGLSVTPITQVNSDGVGVTAMSQ